MNWILPIRLALALLAAVLAGCSRAPEPATPATSAPAPAAAPAATHVRRWSNAKAHSRARRAIAA
jgi:hypothetical protein